jgi:hypothetical protein
MAPIAEAYPGIAVLRLLSVTGTHAASAGGHVHYLAERLPPVLAAHQAWPAPTRPWRGELDEDPLRQPWAVVGAPASDLAWASAHLGPLVTATQVRTWNLSAVWQLASKERIAWLKCVPSFSAHEPALLRALAEHPVPHVIASDGHRELLEPMPGVDGYAASVLEALELIDVLVALQVWSAGELDALAATGVPERRLGPLVEAATKVVRRCAPKDRELARLLETVDARIAAIERCGLPDVLVHGDAHPGNARIGGDAGPGIWFDWGDASIGHPLLDLAVTARAPAERRDQLVAHWLGRWRAAVPGCDPDRAWALLRPIAALADAVTYQGFLDRIEPNERCYHRDDVLPCLRRAAAYAAEERMD